MPIEAAEELKIEPANPEEQQKEKLADYQRSNGIVEVDYGEKFFNPERPEQWQRIILKLNFKTPDKKVVDLLEKLEMPKDWTLVETNSTDVPVAIPEEKIINIPVFKQPFFSNPSAFLILAHEISHARTHYPQQDTKRREQLRHKAREAMNEEDIEDYLELVVEDEYQRNQDALKTISLLKQQGLDLEPELTEEKMAGAVRRALWSYEKLLYPNMLKLKTLAEDFSRLITDVLSVKKEETHSSKIYDYLKELEWHNPKFEFLYGQTAKQWLVDRQLAADRQSAPDVILVFNLPHLYKKMPALWELLDFIKDFSDGEELTPEIRQAAQKLKGEFTEFNGLGIRLNKSGQHEPNSYYYVWGWWLIDRKKPINH